MAELSITPKRSAKSIPHLHDKTKSDVRERKRCILYLIHNYLLEHRLFTSAEALENEAQLDKQYQTCENIDLEIILQEYQSYYYTKFQKYPKVLRKEEDLHTAKPAIRRNSAKSTKAEPKNKTEAQPNLPDKPNFSIEVISLTNGKAVEKSTDATADIEAGGDGENQSPEWKFMADIIMKECVLKNSGVSWPDCIGLLNAIEKLKEATIYPRMYPKLFDNFPTWRGILLFGPPGTGKTLLAKALASEGFTFINVSSSTFVSKWRGESEKMLRVLFDLAKINAPTTIFIDELDAVASTTLQHQHEASSRFKSELLTQIDGVQPLEKPVFVLASTNAPWNLGAALLRRFEKRILVPLPSWIDRMNLLRYYLPDTTQTTEKELETLAKLMVNFSGSDIKTVCKDVRMCVIRDRIEEIKKCGGGVLDKPVRRVAYKDVEDCLRKFKPCIHVEDIEKFDEWNKNYGAW